MQNRLFLGKRRRSNFYDGNDGEKGVAEQKIRCPSDIIPGKYGRRPGISDIRRGLTMKMIKIELKKAFTGSRFWLAFGVGQFLGISSILTVYRSWLSQREYIQYWEDRFPVRQAYTLYNVWMLNEQLSIGRTLFFLLASISGGFSFCSFLLSGRKEKTASSGVGENREKRIFPGKIPGCFSQRLRCDQRNTACESGNISCMFSMGKAAAFLSIF